MTAGALPVARTKAQLRKIDRELHDLVRLIPGYNPWALQESGDYFDPDLAWFPIDWIESNLKIVKGPKAGQPFILDDWQRAMLACVWGFRKADGARRFREVFEYCGKKNGKSAFTASVICLVFATDPEPAKDLYSVAAATKQTKNVWDHVRGMVRANAALRGRWRTMGGRGLTTQKGLSDEFTMSTFLCLASDAATVDGAEPHLAIIDELHRHPTDELLDILRRGARSRPNSLIWITTTADYNRESACNDELARALKVQANKGDREADGADPGYLPCIWRAPKDCNYEDEEVWYAANPGLGTIKSLDGMRASLQEVRDNPSKLNRFLRLELNIVTDTANAWFDSNDWDRCEKERTIDQVVKLLKKREKKLRGKECYVGLDLSRTRDQASTALWFPEPRIAIMRYWIPQDRAMAEEKKHKIPYSLWARKGLITLVPGGVIEYKLIDAELQWLGKRYRMVELGYDPWKAERLRQTLIDDEFEAEMISMRQGPQTLGEASVELERMVIAHELKHGGHPVLRQNATNAAVREDRNKNIVPCKKSSEGPIDGIMALVMAIAGAIISPAGPSLNDLLSEDEILEV